MSVGDGIGGRRGMGPAPLKLATATGDRSLAAGGNAAWFPVAGILAAGLVFFLLFLATGDNSNLQCAVAFMVTAVPFVIVAAEAPDRLLHPLSVFGFTMLLGVAGQAVYITHGGANVFPDELLSGLTTDALTPGLLVVSLGIAALTAGYLATRPNRRPRPGRLLERGVRAGLSRPSPRRAFWTVTGLAALAVAAFAIYAPKVGVHTPADLLTSRKRYTTVSGGETVLGYYRFVMSLAGIGFILAVYTMVRLGISWYSRLGAIAIVSLVITAEFALVTSSRTTLFATLAIAAFVSIALRQREPRPSRIAVGVVIALGGLTVLGGVRAVNAGQAPTLGSQTGVGSMVDNAVGSREWMAIGPVSVLVNRVPANYPYQYGRTMVSLLWAPIPRSLWAGKPPVRLGPVISPAVFGFNVNRRTGDPPGVLGEFWLNGGVIAVAIGMLLLGALVRRVDVWYQMAPASDGLAAIPYGIFVIGLCLLLPINDVTGSVAAVLEALVALGVAMWFVRGPRPSTRTASAAQAIGP